MMEYILADKNTGSDRKAVQDAVDTAASTGIGTVLVPKGEWKLDGAVLLPDYTRIILDGAHLSLKKACGDENVIRNSNAKASHGHTNGAMQTGITVSGKNGAKITAPEPIFIRNARNFTVENLTLASTKGFALFVMMGNNGKVRGIELSDCVKGVGVGATTIDCFFNDIKGSVKEIAFDFDTALNRNLSFHAKGYDIINHIVRDVDITTEKAFAHFDGDKKISRVLPNNVGRIVFTNIVAHKPQNVPAFNIESAYHIVLQDIKTDGFVTNENLTPEQVYLYK